MDKQIELSITSPTTKVNVTSVDADEVARIVKLAGIQSPAPEATITTPPAVVEPTVKPAVEPAVDPNAPIEVLPSSVAHVSANLPAVSDAPVDHDDSKSEDIYAPDEDFEVDMTTDISPEDDEIHLDLTDDEFNDSDLSDEFAMHNDHDGPSSSVFHESQAEHDYGHDDDDLDEENTGIEIPVGDYVWNAERLPQRIKGSNGDSGLLEDTYRSLVNKYHAYLMESERENETGTLSPLSDPTKDNFDKDPLSGETPVDDGSHSPMSTVVRQSFYK